MRLYHGSPFSDLKTIEPRLDLRLGVTGIFVSDEPWGPMAFALLPAREQANVNYATDTNGLLKGIIKTPALNEEGWLYELEAEDGDINQTEAKDIYLLKAAKVIRAQRVTRECLLAAGWKVEID